MFHSIWLPLQPWWKMLDIILWGTDTGWLLGIFLVILLLLSARERNVCGHSRLSQYCEGRSKGRTDYEMGLDTCSWIWAHHVRAHLERYLVWMKCIYILCAVIGKLDWDYGPMWYLTVDFYTVSIPYICWYLQGRYCNLKWIEGGHFFNCVRNIHGFISFHFLYHLCFQLVDCWDLFDWLAHLHLGDQSSRKYKAL